MFTGLVEAVGTIQSVEEDGGSVLFRIASTRISAKVKVNDSVAIEGVCLTVLESDKKGFLVQAVEETLKKTTLGGFSVGRKVNLERPLVFDGAVGGHFVLGHVDGMTTLQAIQPRESSRVFWFTIDKKCEQYLIPVGSIAINGVSLTISELKKQTFAVSIIPHTMNVTTFKNLRKGEKVNVEYDVLGKYVEQLLASKLR